MSHHEARCVNRNGYFVLRREPAEADMFVIWRREYGSELIWTGKMDRIVQTRVGPHATLKATCAAVYLTQQLHLKPSLVALNRLRRGERSSQFRDPHKANRGNEVDEALRDPYKGSDLANRLNAPSVDWRHAC